MVGSLRGEERRGVSSPCWKPPRAINSLLDSQGQLGLASPGGKRKFPREKKGRVGVPVTRVVDAEFPSPLSSCHHPHLAHRHRLGEPQTKARSLSHRASRGQTQWWLLLACSALWFQPRPPLDSSFEPN